MSAAFQKTDQRSYEKALGRLSGEKGIRGEEKKLRQGC
jgi:hypothetical protein